jgi:hypothetical protein
VAEVLVLAVPEETTPVVEVVEVKSSNTFQRL